MNNSDKAALPRRYVRVDPESHALSIEQDSAPSPGPNEVLIKVAAAGLNRADLLQRIGHYPPPEDASPIMGLEVAGEVVAVGSDVSNWVVGDKICALTHGGGYASYALAPIGQCLPVPSGLAFVNWSPEHNPPQCLQNNLPLHCSYLVRYTLCETIDLFIKLL